MGFIYSGTPCIIKLSLIATLNNRISLARPVSTLLHCGCIALRNNLTAMLFVGNTKADLTSPGIEFILFIQKAKVLTA